MTPCPYCNKFGSIIRKWVGSMRVRICRTCFKKEKGEK